MKIKLLNNIAKLTLGGIIIFLLSGCSTQKQGEDWDKENLKGEVKSFTQISYKAEEKNGIIEKGKKERREWDNDFQKVFDKYGNLLEENIYGTNEEVITKINYSYDKSGNLIEEKIYNLHGSDKENTYEYDNKGYRVKMYSISISKVKITLHDEKGNKRKLNLPNKGIYRTYKYDERGNLIEERITRARDGSSAGYKINTYDKSNNKIEEKKYGSDGVLDTRNIYKYNEKGGLIQQSVYTSDKLYSNTYYKYNDRGERIEEKHEYSSSIIINSTYKYEYDEKGNWISRIEFIDGDPKYIEERKYEYYD